MAELETENGVITDPVQIAETLNDMFAPGGGGGGYTLIWAI